MKSFDILVLGAGPAGSCAAISLLKQGYSVAIIEKSDYSEIRIGETIPPQALTALTDLKISDEIFHRHCPSYANQSVWGNSLLEEINFFYNPFGHGWHLDRLQFDKQLISYAENSGAKVFINSTIKNITQDNSGNWNIKFLNPDQIKRINARFAIDATGRSSLLVKRQGGKRFNIDHLIGLVSLQEKCLNQKQSNYTLVESVENGWWYSADLLNDKIVTAFMTDADQYKKEKQTAADFWKQNLNQTKFTHKRCSTSDGPPINIYAASSFISDKRFGENWVAIGDAAMAYDPLTSAGILKAIKDGSNAGSAIHDFFCGKKEAIKKFADPFMKRFNNYLFERKKYYLLEKRWEDNIFWKRRHV